METAIEKKESRLKLTPPSFVMWWYLPKSERYGYILKDKDKAYIEKENNLSKGELINLVPSISDLIIEQKGKTEEDSETVYGEFDYPTHSGTNKEHMDVKITKANELGEKAFHEGKKLVPAHDAALMKLIEGFKVGEGATLIMDAWIKGWTTESIKEARKRVGLPKATEVNPSGLETLTETNPELKDNKYVAQSEVCATVDTVVPASMVYDMHKAIETIDRRVNGVDEYVAEKLGYIKGKCDIEQRKEGLKCLCDAFSAEQVDAIAVAIYNIEQKNQGVIIGDQTGIGKGRIAAGMLRYAVARGLKPIFLTEKPSLFSDLFRDVINIGSDDAIPLEVLMGYKEIEKKSINPDTEEADEDTEEADEDAETSLVRVAQYKRNTNYANDIKGKRRLVPYIVNGRSGKTEVKDEQGNVLYKGLPKNENDKIILNGKVPAEYDFVLATYSQFRGAVESSKMTFLRSISMGNVIVMDESHNASGSSNTGKMLRSVLENTEGVTFLSATFAKRPDNMPIYAAKTSMSDANLNNEQLVEAIQRGGVALQEIISSQLVSEGQMLRRERSFEGVEVNYIYLDATQNERGYPNLDKEQEHRAIMDASTEIIRDIIAFQRDYVNDEIEAMDKIAKAEYSEVEQRKGTAEGGISNSPIFSGIFNIINQLLFSIKAEAVAETAIERLKQGKKPVIAFANTMESFLNTLTDDDGNLVEEGDVINSDFSKIFEKRLKGVLRYTVTSAEGEKEYKMLVVEEMAPQAILEYKYILDKIKKASLGIKSSPIDVVIDKLEKAGYSVGEVTGRDRQLKLLDGKRARVVNKVKENANDLFRRFNNNELDCLLINQSGSTGASAHALPNVKVSKDRVKQRVMIILQAELNINTEVQKRGRINRTGQISKPIYDYVISAIPAEKRLMMMLQKKLKSLDANTTSNQKQSKKILDVNDFLNKYGDTIVEEYLRDNLLINTAIGDPLKLQELEEGKESQVQDKAHKVSGRIAILSVKDQENFYNEMTERYASLVEYLIQTGEYDLEVENLNLEAETLDKDIVVVGNGGDSVFGRHSILERVTVNNLRKPFSKSELDNLIKESLNGMSPEKNRELLKTKYVKFMETAQENEEKETIERYEALKKQVHEEKAVKAETNVKKRQQMIAERINTLEGAKLESIERQKTLWERKAQYIVKLLDFFTIGKVIGYPSVVYSQNNDWYKGVFLGFDIKESAKNPYAPSAMRLRFAIASSQKYIAVPASKTDIIAYVKEITYSNIMRDEQEYVIENWDEITKSKSSEKSVRYVVTGNILQAFGNPELKGSLISYTTKDGGVKKGILLPEGFSKEARTREQKDLRITVPIGKCLPIAKNMSDGRSLVTNDDFAIIKKYNEYMLSVPASKNRGSKFYENPVILKLTIEGNFNKTADKMTATMESKKIGNLLDYLQDEFRCSVDLVQSEFDNYIKDTLVIEEYHDEVKKPEPLVFVEKLTEVDELGLAEKQFEAEQKTKAAELAIEKEKEKEKEGISLENRKINAQEKLLKFIKLLMDEKMEQMKRGGKVESEVTFFDVVQTLTHYVHNDKMEGSQMDSIIMQINSNRIKVSDLLKIDGITKEIVDNIIKYSKSEQIKFADGGLVGKSYTFMKDGIEHNILVLSEDDEVKYKLDGKEHTKGIMEFKEYLEKEGITPDSRGGNISDYYVQINDLFVDKNTFAVTTREDIKVYQAKSLEEAIEWANDQNVNYEEVYRRESKQYPPQNLYNLYELIRDGYLHAFQMGVKYYGVKKEGREYIVENGIHTAKGKASSMTDIQGMAAYINYHKKDVVFDKDGNSITTEVKNTNDYKDAVRLAHAVLVGFNNLTDADIITPSMVEGYSNANKKMREAVEDAVMNKAPKHILETLRDLEFITNELRMERGIIRKADREAIPGYAEQALGFLNKYSRTYV